jgi:hypothetical protein
VSFKAKVSATTNLDNLKCAIVSWSGTADTYTTDIVSAWNAEGTNPTLVANWTYENTPVNLSPTTSYATYRVQGIIDASSVANVAVFIWSDVTTTTVTSDILYLADVQAEIGAVATPFERRHRVLETLLVNDTLNRPVLAFSSTTDRDAQLSSPTTGSLTSFTAGSVFDGLYYYDGVAWRPPWNAPWGHVVSASDGTARTSSGTTALKVGNVSDATATLFGNRRLRLTFSCTWNGSTLNDEFNFTFYYGGLVTQISDPQHVYIQETTAGRTVTTTFVRYLSTPSAASASTVFNVTVTRTTGSGTITLRNANYSSIFIVEDMGPSGVPI